MENFLECYHCQVAHPSFSDVIDVSSEGYRLASTETFGSHYARLRDTQRNGHYDTSGDVQGQFHLVWPNIKVNVMPGRPNMSIGPLVPDGPQRTEGFLDYFFAAGTDESWVADFLALDTQVGVEDRVLVDIYYKSMARARGHVRRRRSVRPWARLALASSTRRRVRYDDQRLSRIRPASCGP